MFRIKKTRLGKLVYLTWAETPQNGVKSIEPPTQRFSLKQKGTLGMRPLRKWAERELNPRHKDFQSFALPTELSALQKSELKNMDFYSNLKSFYNKLFN